MHQERVLFLPALSPEGDGMIKSEIWHESHSRFKLKETKKAIARTLGLSILTIRKVLRQAMPRPYQRAKPESGLRPCRWSEPSPPQLHAASRPPVVVAAAQLTLCT